MNRPQANSLWESTLESITQFWGDYRWTEVGIIVGCSGGADSVALLCALHQMHLRLQTEGAPTRTAGFVVVAHFNHGLRGQKSDRDQRFVRDLASKLGLPFITANGSGDTDDEATLRNQRLDFLVDAAKQQGARYIAVGHTVDDNVETCLHHLFRGTGPRGLAGIPPRRVVANDFVLVRPLLMICRDQLRSGLRQIGQGWCEDESNTNNVYRRNWIRNDLIPLIESEYPNAAVAIGRAIDGQQEWREVIDDAGEQWLTQYVRLGPPVTVHRAFDAESRPRPAIVVAALQRLWDQQGWPRGPMSRDHWIRLAKTIRSKSIDRYNLPGAIDVTAESDRVEITSQH